MEEDGGCRDHHIEENPPVPETCSTSIPPADVAPALTSKVIKVASADEPSVVVTPPPKGAKRWVVSLGYKLLKLRLLDSKQSTVTKLMLGRCCAC